MQCIYRILSESDLVTIPQDITHLPWPKIDRSVFYTLGNNIREKEKQINNQLQRESFVTLRLDLRSFSKISKKIFNGKVFSVPFSEAMNITTNSLMVEFNAVYGFTQSDEITLILPKREYPSEHPFVGKRDKLVSLSASFASVVLYKQMQHLLSNDDPFKPTFQFDCRAASWSNISEAFSLIIWRAYDCNVNCFSDAVYKSPILPKKSIMLNSIEKLKLLHSNDLLPLHDHQKYGSLFIKKRIIKQGVNPLTEKTVDVERGVIVQSYSPILSNIREYGLEYYSA